MQKIFRDTLKAACLLCLWIPMAGHSQQFVDLTAEIDGTSWAYDFFTDSLPGGEKDSSSLFDSNSIIHCVVGTNSWFMESDSWLMNGKVQCWFTGSNIITRDVITKGYKDAGGYMHPPGETQVKVDQSPDGNPGRPI